MTATSALILPPAPGHWLRAAGIRTGIVTNQPGVGRGLISARQMPTVNQRVEALLAHSVYGRYARTIAHAAAIAASPRPA